MHRNETVEELKQQVRCISCLVTLGSVTSTLPQVLIFELPTD